MSSLEPFVAYQLAQHLPPHRKERIALDPRRPYRKRRLELPYACIIRLSDQPYSPHFLGRRRVLPETWQDSQARDTKSALKRGPVAIHALEPVNISDCYIPVCRCTGWKVSCNVPLTRFH